MPTLKIDGREVAVDKGMTVLQAAARLGIAVPHYCYHPGLSIAGNCRMCLVEIEKMPKLQIACHIPCAEGMVVRTDTAKVKETRRHVLEFLLVNHPLDCPVCDQAGECRLQDYYMEHGLYDSRLNEEKVKKKKAVPIGPHVMLDSERCILCSRCVRFSDEISKTHDFGIFERGDHAEIGLYQGTDLTNAYSGNVVDICPVGALTDRDFRFKCRVWYLRKTNSICNGCARGCNITLEVNTERQHHALGERVMRIKPRYQPAVNRWWMCDEGRYGYTWIDRNRILSPRRRALSAVEQVGWNEILTECAFKIKALLSTSRDSLAVFLSPQQSNESLYLARKFFSEGLGLPHLFLCSPSRPGSQDDFLIRADKNPNRKGAEILGWTEEDGLMERFLHEAGSGRWKGVYLFGQDLIVLSGDARIEQALRRLELVIFHGTNNCMTSEIAHFVLPCAAFAEMSGTFTNFEGKVQRFRKALEPIADAKSDFEILSGLVLACGVSLADEDGADLFVEMAKRFPGFDNVVSEAMSETGVTG